jgi:hypothetical protein
MGGEENAGKDRTVMARYEVKGCSMRTWERTAEHWPTEQERSLLDKAERTMQERAGYKRQRRKGYEIAL